jgi:predicted dehydrogenase
MDTVRWGIVAPGTIAAKFAEALNKTEKTVCAAVASRTKEKAQQFAEKWNFKKAYGSYTELFADPEIDIVYISSPHVNHAELSIAAMKAGKSVLCEKPAAVNAIEFRKVQNCAKETGCFFMEAMWMLFNPTIRLAVDYIQKGKIGKLRHIMANFCFIPEFNPEKRLFNPALAGGALLDVGIYPITFAMRTAAAPVHKNLLTPEAFSSAARLGNKGHPENSGIDYWNAETFLFSKGNGSVNNTVNSAADAVTAELTSSIDSAFGSHADDALLFGTEGTILLPKFWMAQEFILSDSAGHECEKTKRPFRVNGYEYEIEAVTDCLIKEDQECRQHTIADTLQVIEVLDAVRRRWNMIYPFEKQTQE